MKKPELNPFEKLAESRLERLTVLRAEEVRNLIVVHGLRRTATLLRKDIAEVEAILADSLNTSVQVKDKPSGPSD